MMPVAQQVAQARRKGPDKKLLISGLVTLIVIGYVIVCGMRDAAVYSLTIAELKAKGDAAVGQGVRVTGTLDNGSVEWDAAQLLLSFRLRDGQETLDVVYNGIKPEAMNGSAEVIVEGKLQPDGSFAAQRLLFTCPSKYEPETQPESSEQS